ncbi:hypothetical protein [Aureimonas sp. D3]|uniref:hypothetical protein n=1 Tax=Aureimonas sp. D3 TaxID=1638164 RepID=UPI001AEC2466|nr:hypothetical protein [Aureimonas sp. D3]
MLVTMPAMARDKAPSPPEPFHYTVRFGAMIGSLEPIAGEMLCVSNKDCEILLSFWPRIELRLRPPRGRNQPGEATITCGLLSCAFSNGSTRTSYSGGIDRLRVYDDRNRRSGVLVPLVWKPGPDLIGSIDIVVRR